MQNVSYDSVKVFNELLFCQWGKEFFWFDEKGIFRLNEDILVEITLNEVFHYDPHYYSGYIVRIIHKKTGELSKHFFSFKQYLNDLDWYKQHDYLLWKHPDNGKEEILWHNDKTPSEESIKSLTEKIKEYINLFC